MGSDGVPADEMIAALFVEENGVYSNLPDVDVWGISRDARNYAGPWPVVCHPPCERWGRYWSGGPMLARGPKAKKLGDDGGCFASALVSVRRWGGVLEHPEASHAWRHFDLRPPSKCGGWEDAGDEMGSVCCVEQGHYGHPARKATWLYVARWPYAYPYPQLKWGASNGVRLDEGFHSKAERIAARVAGRKPIKRLSRAENLATPIAFRDVLLGIANEARGMRWRDAMGG